MRVSRLVDEDRAQATVEMVVVAPVMIVLALIAYNVADYSAAVARFDRVAPDVVMAHAVSPEGEGSVGTPERVAGYLQEAMEGYRVEVDVACEGGGEAGGSMLDLAVSPTTYRCTMRYEPWPSGLSIAGVSLGAPLALEHERAVVIDPWKPGVVV